MAYELYAKVEPLLGIEEATLALHQSYLHYVDEFAPQTLLDVGCGQGDFLERIKAMGVHGVGIDLSQTMIDKAQKKGLSVSCKAIADTAGSFDMITSIFDVLNFLTLTELKAFFQDVERLLKPEGYFLADINTLFGFEEVADGCMVHNDENQTLTVEANYESNRLTTEMNYFSRDKACFTKASECIVQYYHTIESILDQTGLTLQMEVPLSLYDETPDKSLLIFRKEAQ